MRPEGIAFARDCSRGRGSPIDYVAPFGALAESVKPHCSRAASNSEAAGRARPATGAGSAGVGSTDAPRRHCAGGAGVGRWAQAHDPCALIGVPDRSTTGGTPSGCDGSITSHPGGDPKRPASPTRAEPL